MEITNITKKRIVEYLNQGKRFDNRKLFEFRNIEIKTGISKQAEGSVLVKIGDTEIAAGVKMDIGEPYPDSEDEGTMAVTVELLPMASEKFEPGPPGVEAIELARIVDRGIRESGMINFKKLCIKKSELVWNIFIDIYPINDDGNLIDASCLAAIAALLTARMPKFDEKKKKVKFGEFTSMPLPLTEKIPLTITIYRVGKSFLFDPVSEEEEASDGRISFAMYDKEKELRICALQKGREAFFF